jgi:hypothetical protein
MIPHKFAKPGIEGIGVRRYLGILSVNLGLVHGVPLRMALIIPMILSSLRASPTWRQSDRRWPRNAQ